MALLPSLYRCVVASALLISNQATAAESSPAVLGPTPLAASTAKPKVGPAPLPAPSTGVVSYGRSPAQLRIESVLNKPLKSPLEFVAIPMSQLAQKIAEDYDIPLIFDLRALKAAGLTPDEEVTISIGNVSLKSALRLLLKSASDGAMTYIVDRHHAQYAGALDVEDAAGRVSGSVGVSGPNEEYVFNTVTHLKALGIRDHWLENVAGRLAQS